MSRSSQRIFLGLGIAGLALGAGGAAIAQEHMGGGMGMRDPFGNATITRAEAQAKAGEMFARLDVNGDGKLDQADRIAALGKRFDMMDTNHDGVLSKQEFIDAHQRMMEAMRGSMQNRAGHGMMKRPIGGGGMGAMDTNGDRAISRDEFIAGALKRFDAADANHDGKLTPEERRAAFRQGMQMHMRHMGGQEMGGPGMGEHAVDDMPPPPPASGK